MFPNLWVRGSRILEYEPHSAQNAAHWTTFIERLCLIFVSFWWCSVFCQHSDRTGFSLNLCSQKWPLIKQHQSKWTKELVISSQHHTRTIVNIYLLIFYNFSTFVLWEICLYGCVCGFSQMNACGKCCEGTFPRSTEKACVLKNSTFQETLRISACIL